MSRFLRESRVFLVATLALAPLGLVALLLLRDRGASTHVSFSVF